MMDPKTYASAIENDRIWGLLGLLPCMDRPICEQIMLILYYAQTYLAEKKPCALHDQL